MPSNASSCAFRGRSNAARARTEGRSAIASSTACRCGARASGHDSSGASSKAILGSRFEIKPYFTCPGLSPRRLAQPIQVPHGGLSEQPLVLPTELRGVVVAHPVAGTGGIQVLAEHDAPGLLEPELLLELQGEILPLRLQPA